MKALSKLKAEEGIWMTDVPEPEVGHNDLLIKIRKTAICGTDVHIYNWDQWSQKTIPVPMVVGHEYVGEVVGIGQEVKGFNIGDRVSGEGHITCGHCRNCRGGRTHLCRNTVGVGVNRPGCFAEYLVIPAFNAFKIPDNISDALASIFDPFGNAVHTALSFDLVGEDVLVSGAGPIGIMAAAVAKHVGARNVVITAAPCSTPCTPEAVSRCWVFRRQICPSTGTKSSSKGCSLRAFMAARCSKPGTRWLR